MKWVKAISLWLFVGLVVGVVAHALGIPGAPTFFIGVIAGAATGFYAIRKWDLV